MPNTLHYIGPTTGGSFTTASQWSLTANGSSAGIVPASGDTLYFDRSVVTDSITAVTSVVPAAVYVTQNGDLNMQGTTAVWQLAAGYQNLNIYVQAANGNLAFSTYHRCKIVGHGVGVSKLIKTGAAAFGLNTNASVPQPAYQDIDIEVQEGDYYGVGVQAAGGPFGNGSIILYPGTGFGSTTNFTAGTTATYSNNFVLGAGIYPVTLNSWVSQPALNGWCPMEIQGTISCPDPAGVWLSIGPAGVNNTVTFSGAVTCTTGSFTKEGSSTLRLNAANPNLTVPVSVTAGDLTLLNINALQNATLTWTGTVGTVTFINGANIGAISGSTAANTLALGANAINVGAKNTSTTYSGKFTGSALITKQGTGTWTLNGDNTGHTGGFTVTAGTLSARSSGSLGSSTTGAVAVTNTGALDVSGGVTVNKGTLGFTIGGTGNPILTSTSGTNTLTCGSITLNVTAPIDISATQQLTLGNSSPMTGAFGITKTGAGTLVMGNGANSFTGAVTVSAGTLSVAVLANGGAGNVSSIGTGALVSAISLTGTLRYTGIGHSTNRSLTLTGNTPSLNASGTGAVTFSAATQAALTAGQTRTLTLTGTASNALANTLSFNLSDPSGAFTAVTKTGACKWVLSGATVNYTGATSVTAGILDLGNASRTIGSAGSGITINGATAVLTNGATTTPTVTSVGGVTLSSGTLSASIAGATPVTISGGTVTDGYSINSSAAIAVSGGTTNADFTGSGTITVSGTGNITVNGSISGSHPVIISAGMIASPNSSTGNVTISGTASVSGAISGTGNDVAISAGTLSGAVSGSGTLAISGTGTVSAGGITGSRNVSISGGTLGAPNGSSGTLSVSGGTVIGNTTASPTINVSGGTISGVISAASTALTATSGTTLINSSAGSSGSNTYGGSTAISSGATVQARTDTSPAGAGAGRVFGLSDVEVTGTVVTRATTQLGRLRYGGNLTFKANSTLSIGGF